MRNASLIRAIGSEFIRRKYRSFVLLATLAGVVVGGLMIWLVSINAWWWLLAAPVFMLLFMGAVIAFVIRILLKIATPKLTKEQSGGVQSFVDKLERVADTVQTPPFVILFRIVRDVMWPREGTFIQSFAQDSTTLEKDFAELQRQFR